MIAACERLGIQFQVVPNLEGLAGISHGRAFWESERDRLVLHLSGIGDYRVGHGILGVCSPAAGSDPSLVNSVFMGLPLAALLVQRHFLVLAAAAVAMPGGAVVFAGGPCVGKSSLALSLALEGHPLLADGVAAVDLQSGGVPSVIPIPGPVEISQDVLDALSIPTERVHRVREGVPRFCVSGIPWMDEPVPLRAICLLSSKREGQPEIVRLSGRKRVLSVLTHSYNRFSGEGGDGLQRLFLNVTGVLQAIPVLSLRLPERPLQFTAAANMVYEACGLG